MKASNTNLPFLNYFLGLDSKPVITEMRAFFPSLRITDFSIDCYRISTLDEKQPKDFLISFDEEEINVILFRNGITWKKKVFHSYCHFIGTKDDLLNFLFCDTRKIPELKKWRKDN